MTPLPGHKQAEGACPLRRGRSVSRSRWRGVMAGLITAALLPVAGAAQDAAALQVMPARDGAGAHVMLADGQVVVLRNAGDLQIAVRMLIAQGRVAEAQHLARAYAPDHPDHAVRVAYVDGLAASAQGNDVEAVRLWRGILAQRPDLDLVRVQLTGALARLQLHDSARYQAEQLIAAGVDDRIDGRLSGLLRSLDAARPVQFRGYLSLLPSTNVNNGTDNDSVAIGPVVGTIPEDQRRQSGLGVAVGGEASVRRQLDPRHAAVAALEARVERYPSIDRTNVTSQLSFGLERRLDHGAALARVLTGTALKDGAQTYRYSGLSVETNLRFAERWRLYFGPEYRDETFPYSPGEDGAFVDLPLQIDRFSGPDSFVRLIAGASMGRKAEERFSFDEARVGLGYFKEFSHGLSLYADATYAHRLYHADYPGIDDPREDHRTSVGVTVIKRDFTLAGFAPQVSLRHTRTRSNAAFNDTTRTEADLRFVQEF